MRKHHGKRTKIVRKPGKHNVERITMIIMGKAKQVDLKKFTCIESSQKLIKSGHIILTKSNAFKIINR